MHDKWISVFGLIDVDDDVKDVENIENQLSVTVSNSVNTNVAPHDLPTASSDLDTADPDVSDTEHDPDIVRDSAATPDLSSEAASSMKSDWILLLDFQI